MNGQDELKTRVKELDDKFGKGVQKAVESDRKRAFSVFGRWVRAEVGDEVIVFNLDHVIVWYVEGNYKNDECRLRVCTSRTWHFRKWMTKEEAVELLDEFLEAVTATDKERLLMED